VWRMMARSGNHPWVRLSLSTIFNGIIGFSIILFLLNIWLQPLVRTGLDLQDSKSEYSSSADKQTISDSLNPPPIGEIKQPKRDTLLIAAYPVSSDRLISLWSQLECFVDERFQTIVVAAPDWARDDDILEPFLRNAAESIPHLKNINIEVKYYVNDRYDVGLWCDALYDNNLKIFKDHDEFVLLNDSVLAIQHYMGVLDLLQTKNLSMTSLTYSDVPGTFYWMESFFRAFNKNGMSKYMKHACTKPATHPSWCRGWSKLKAKRCIVDIFEIDIAGLFLRKDVAGIFSADVPKEMIVDKWFQDSATWTSHWVYWLLLKEQTFPVMKSTHVFFNERAKNQGIVLNQCAVHLDPKFLIPIGRKDTNESNVTKYLIYPHS